MKKNLHLIHRKNGGAYVASQYISSALSQSSSNEFLFLDELALSKAKYFLLLNKLISKFISKISGKNSTFSFCFIKLGILDGFDVNRYDEIFVHWTGVYLSLSEISEFPGRVTVCCHDLAPVNGGYHFANPVMKLNSFGMAVQALVEKNMKVLYSRDHSFSLRFLAFSKWVRSYIHSNPNWKQIRVDQVGVPIETAAHVVPKRPDPSVLIVGFGAWRGKNVASKNYHTIFDIIEKVKNNPNFKIAQVGDELENEAADILLGPQDHKDMDKFYNLIDVFVSTSSQETFGLMCYEALQRGKPVLIYDGPHVNTDDIISGHNGFRCHSADNFIERLEQIQKSDMLYEALSLNALTSEKVRTEIAKVALCKL